MNEKIKSKAQEMYPIESHANEHTAFLQGAKGADKTMIDKACEWLKDHIDFEHNYPNSKEEFINDFKKAMEE